MKSERITQWLHRHIAVKKTGCWVGAPLTFVGGAVVVFLTFWLAYLMVFLADEGFNEIIHLASGHKWHTTHFGRLMISGVFIVLLFVAWARSTPWDLANYRKVRENRALEEFADSQGVGAFAPILSNPQTSANIIAQALYYGPHLMLGSWNLVRQLQQLSAIDQTACVSALELLVNKPGRVSQRDFAVERPNLDWRKVRNELAGISGVLVLEDGLQMTPEFREELSGSTT